MAARNRSVTPAPRKHPYFSSGQNAPAGRAPAPCAPSPPPRSQPPPACGGPGSGLAVCRHTGPGQLRGLPPSLARGRPPRPSSTFPRLGAGCTPAVQSRGPASHRKHEDYPVRGGAGDEGRLPSDTPLRQCRPCPLTPWGRSSMPPGPAAPRPEVARQRPGSHGRVGDGVCRGRPGAGPPLIRPFIRARALGCVSGAVRGLRT